MTDEHNEKVSVLEIGDDTVVTDAETVSPDCRVRQSFGKIEWIPMCAKEVELINDASLDVARELLGLLECA